MGADYLQLAIAIVIPWYFGASACRWLLRRESNTPRTLITGMGFFLGQFAVVILLYLAGHLGMGLPFWGIVALLATAAAALQLTLRRSSDLPGPGPAATGDIRPWQWACLGLLALLLTLRYFTLAQEISLRPLFAWDAWMNWAPKSIVWFHNGELTSFVSPKQWLGSDDRDVYTLGALGAWRFPPAIPLIQLWTMLALDQADHNLVYLPWLLVPIALALALYGYLRAYGLGPFGSASAAYLLLSLPYLNVHTALVGYADIWLAAAFGTAVLALSCWERSRANAHLALAITLAAFAATMKVPGLIFAGIVLLCALVVALELLRRDRLIALLACLGLGAAVLAVGVDLELPGEHRLVLSFEEFTIPYIGSFSLAYHPVHQAILSTLFSMNNWHLLWYLVAATLVGSIALQQHAAHTLSLRLALGLGLVFILFVYFFTYRYKFALDYTQVNRALIYLTPLAVGYIATTLSSISKRLSSAQQEQP